MAKPTPGPWAAIKSTSYLDESPSWMVAGVAHCGDGELSEANARLISAAPDMLEALEKIAALAEPPDRNLAGLKLDEIDFIARAAIAKAKGEANG